MFNFWFSSFKFILIVLFVIIGVGLIFGFGSSEPIGFANWINDGGLFPNGAMAVVMTMMTVVFAYGSADLFAAGASESKNAEKDLPRSIKATIISLVVCYFASLVVMITILPWSQVGLSGSPFAYVFRVAGIGSAELIVNLFVLTSALSSANSFIYSSVRALWSMGNYNQAPKFVSKVNNKKVSVNALIIPMLFAALEQLPLMFYRQTLFICF